MSGGVISSLELQEWENVLVRHSRSGLAAQLTLLRVTTRAYFWIQVHSGLIVLRAESGNTDCVQDRGRGEKQREGFRANRKVQQTFVVGLVEELSQFAGNLLSAPFSTAAAIAVTRLQQGEVGQATLDFGIEQPFQIEKVGAATQLPRGFYVPQAGSIEYRNRGADSREYDEELRARIANRSQSA